MGYESYPSLDATTEWRELIAERRILSDQYWTGRAAQLPVTVETISVEQVVVYSATPHGADPNDERVCVEMHGGALITGAGMACRGQGAVAALRNGIPTWSVDYRMPPDYPYPAALDDGLTVYRHLLERHRPDQIAIGGVSAGGNLAAAMILRARDEGLALPGAAVLLTPEVDLTESGDSFQVNLGIDTVLSESLMAPNLLYANGHELNSPYISPLFGDFVHGFPPTILTTGTRDLFLSNTVRMHRALRAAGVAAELHVMEAAPHGGFFGESPEDAEIDQEIRRFIVEHLSPGSR